MEDTSKFGGGRGAQFGDRVAPGPDAGHCGQCEAMLADVLDGALDSEEQAMFDAHLAICGPCAGMLADAQRGAAWLEMLRDPRPEPPAELLERIFAQTAGVQAAGAHASGAPAAAYAFGHAATAVSGDAAYAAGLGSRAAGLPFRQRFADSFRHTFLHNGILQPRLAMTAAMAFFSIALTMNLTGVRITALRPGDLRASNLKQSFYSANARVVRYYEGLRVVYELESRVHDLETDSDTGAGQKAAPASPANLANPGNGQPSASPSLSPEQNAPQNPKPPAKAPGPGSSRREALQPSARVLAVGELFLSRQNMTPSSGGRIDSAGIGWTEAVKVRARA